MAEPDTLPAPTAAAEPLREDDIRALGACACCGKKIAQFSLPLFWKVEAERHMLDTNAAQRRIGLDLMVGSPALARAFSADEPLTQPLQKSAARLICDGCFLSRLPELFEE